MIVVLINIKKLFKKDTRKIVWKNLIINGIFIILISLFFYGPLLEHKSATDYAAFSKGTSKEGFLDHRIYPSQLIFGKNQLDWAYKLSENKLNESMSFSLGLPIIVALLFTPIALPKIKKEHRLLYIITFCIGIIFTMMSTTIFPWELIPKIPSVIQFPWRFLLVSTLAFSIIAGVNIYKCVGELKIEKMYVLLLAILICSGTYITDVVKYKTDFDLSYVYEEHKLDGNQCAAYEYLPEKAINDLDYISERKDGVIILSGNATIKAESKENGNLKFTLEENENGVILELPYIYYLGYNIEINNTKIEYKESDNGFIMLEIPEKCNGNIQVTYKGTKLEKITTGISIVSAVGFIAYIIYKKISRKEK